MILGFSITQAGEAVEADFAVLIRHSGNVFLGVQHDCQNIYTFRCRSPKAFKRFGRREGEGKGR
jgi:hypothetical protein